VDEYQDINHGQYRIIKALAPPDKDLCVIGDPNQSIYGFRGSNVRFFTRFLEDYPQGTIIHLNQNYRSTKTILEASYQIITNQNIATKTENDSASRVYSEIDGIKTINILELISEKAEAVAIGKTIEALAGGLSFHAIDSGKIENINTKEDRSFSDFAVLYRTNSQSIKIIDGQGSFVDFKRTVKLLSGISDETIKIFTGWCCQNHFILTKGFYNARRFPIPGMSKARQLKFHDFLVNP
jgi:superfamily I DNA/RNA helicase